MNNKMAFKSRMLFSELYKTMVNNVTFEHFRGAIAPPAGSAPYQVYPNQVRMFFVQTLLCLLFSNAIY